MDIGVGGQQMDVKHDPPRTAQGHKTVYVGNLSWDTTWQGLKDVSVSSSFCFVAILLKTRTI